MSVEIDRVLGGSVGRRARSSSPKVQSGRVDVVPVLADSIVILTVCMVATLSQPGWIAAAAVACLALAGTYRRRLTLSTLDVTPRIATASAGTAVIVSLVLEPLEIVGFLSTAGSVFGAAIVGRSLGYGVERTLRRNGLLRRRAAMVGAGPAISLLVETITAEPEYGLDTVGLPVPLSDPPGLAAALRSHRVDTVIVAVPPGGDDGLDDAVAELSTLQCEVFCVPALWRHTPVRAGMDRIGAVPLLRLGGPRRGGLNWRLKSATERFIAGAALLALAPLMASLAVAVYLSDTTAPVLFRQRRIGLDGREFELLKFRSLRPANEFESQTTWNISGDSRLTTFGRLLRASSLDELPQLWNVVRGDMALVGPRPERPHFVEQFSATIPGYAARHRVPVGLTGWAAVNGLRGDTSIAERARYDNFYIVNWNLWFDVTIVLRTLAAVIANFRQDRVHEPEGLPEASCRNR